MNKKVTITTTLLTTLSLTACASPQQADPILPQSAELQQRVSAPPILKPAPPARIIKPAEEPQVAETQAPEPAAEEVVEVPAETAVEELATTPEATEPPVEAPEAPEVIENAPEGSESLTQAPAGAEQPAPAAATTAVVTGAPISPGGKAILTTLSGTGTLPVTVGRDPASTAPNLPVYISSICDGTSVYSGAYNATSEPLNTTISYSGNNCSIHASVGALTPAWAGTYNAAIIATGQPTQRQGTPSVTAANWVTRPVAGVDSFILNTPAGFSGAVDLKLTACSSQGGTADVTAQYACGNLVQQGVGSTVNINILDGAGILATTQAHVSANRHHDTLHLPLSRATTGAITITVTHAGGSAMLVHAPGTRAVGTY